MSADVYAKVTLVPGSPVKLLISTAQRWCSVPLTACVPRLDHMIPAEAMQVSREVREALSMHGLSRTASWSAAGDGAYQAPAEPLG